MPSNWLYITLAALLVAVGRGSNDAEFAIPCEQFKGFYSGSDGKATNVSMSDGANLPQSTTLTLSTYRATADSERVHVRAAFSTSMTKSAPFEISLSVHDDDPGCDVFSQMNGTLQSIYGRFGYVSLATRLPEDSERHLYARVSLGMSTPDAWGSLTLSDDGIECVPIDAFAYCIHRPASEPPGIDSPDSKVATPAQESNTPGTGQSVDVDSVPPSLQQETPHPASPAPPSASQHCPGQTEPKMEIRPTKQAMARMQKTQKPASFERAAVGSSEVTMVQFSSISLFVLLGVLLGILWLSTFAIYFCRCIRPSGSRIY